MWGRDQNRWSRKQQGRGGARESGRGAAGRGRGQIEWAGPEGAGGTRLAGAGPEGVGGACQRGRRGSKAAPGGVVASLRG